MLAALIGLANANISNSYSTASVNGGGSNGGSSVGGFAGDLASGYTISDSYRGFRRHWYQTPVTGLGALLEKADGTIQVSYSTENISGGSNEGVGGRGFCREITQAPSRILIVPGA